MLVTMALPASRKVTVQPAGRPAEIAASVAAARSNESATALPLDTISGTRIVAPGLTVSGSTAVTSGPAPTPVPPGTDVTLVRSTMLPVMVVSVSVAVAVLVVSSLDVATTGSLNGPPMEPGGSTALTTMLIEPPAGTGPESGMPLPLVSCSGVRPSAWNSWNVVPGGNGLLAGVPKVMSKLSVPLPVLVSTLVNDTLPPCGELGTVPPVKVRAADWLTVYWIVLVLLVPTWLAPSL